MWRRVFLSEWECWLEHICSQLQMSLSWVLSIMIVGSLVSWSRPNTCARCFFWQLVLKCRLFYTMLYFQDCHVVFFSPVPLFKKKKKERKYSILFLKVLSFSVGMVDFFFFFPCHTVVCPLNLLKDVCLFFFQCLTDVELHEKMC